MLWYIFPPFFFLIFESYETLSCICYNISWKIFRWKIIWKIYLTVFLKGFELADNKYVTKKRIKIISNNKWKWRYCYAGISLWRCGYRRIFRLPQRSHLRTLKNFVGEKSRKRCEKLGKHWIKSGNREILRRFIFFSCIRACI